MHIAPTPAANRPRLEQKAPGRPGRVPEEEPRHPVYGQEDGPHVNTQSSGRDPRATDVPHKVTARDPAPRISNPHDARISIIFSQG